MKILCVIACLMFSMTIFANINPKVIYGDDNRLDVYESQNSDYVELARSTAAMMSEANLTFEGGFFSVGGSTLVSRGICQNAKFADQITPARCSGFLIADDLLVTAGHCVRYQSDCDNYVWIFDFGISNEAQEGYIISESSLFHCSEVVEQTFSYSNDDDYALIRLDRKVTDRDPLSYRKTGEIKKNTPLVVIGHPTGLPTKIADDAYARKINHKEYFITNLDTFGGNSGSAVFNANTLEVEGILVRGETDYVYDYANGCRVPKKCEMEGCRGEDVTRITNIEALYNL